MLAEVKRVLNEKVLKKVLKGCHMVGLAMSLFLDGVALNMATKPLPLQGSLKDSEFFKEAGYARILVCLLSSSSRNLGWNTKRKTLQTKYQ